MPNEEKQQNPEEVSGANVIDNVIAKIYDAKNILIALSSDPSVDELAAAIGLSIYFDRMGKRVTTIYSGTTPNALEFLKPEEQFTASTDALQDFVVAIDKNKADHLRYKIDGNYVKVYITPYGTKIGEEDLEFSYGDYNVDLVIALDVANGIDLDDALREHGRIMHDATVINMTIGQPGKFGEIEWNEQGMSSISEMAAELSYAFGEDYPVGKDEATAYLTGIVAATDRFSNSQTTPTTMLAASKLMKSGANQQLIAKNITSDVDNAMFQNLVKAGGEDQMSVVHAEISDDEELPPKTNPEETPVAEEPAKDEGMIDLKEIEDSFKEAEKQEIPTEMEEIPAAEIPVEKEPAVEEPAAEEEPQPSMVSEPNVNAPVMPVEMSAAPGGPLPPEQNTVFSQESKTVVEPSAEFSEDMLDGQPDNVYGNMLKEAIGGGDNPAAVVAPVVSTEEVETPAMDFSAVDDNNILPPPPAPISGFDQLPMPPMEGPAPMSNAIPPMPEMPAAPVAPAPAPAPEVPVVPTVPEVPAEPVVSAEPVVPIEPAQPVVPPAPEPLGPQPAMQDQIYNNPANDPTAFRIPGM